MLCTSLIIGSYIHVRISLIISSYIRLNTINAMHNNNLRAMIKNTKHMSFLPIETKTIKPKNLTPRNQISPTIQI